MSLPVNIVTLVSGQQNRAHCSRFTNSTDLLFHGRTWPLATCWPVIRNIATRLEMKVQEAGGTPAILFFLSYDCLMSCNNDVIPGDIFRYNFVSKQNQ